eukprot:jgi/Chrpa1/24379/Chrysochromulina_OHIO_Genome00026191-RA
MASSNIGLGVMVDLSKAHTEGTVTFMPSANRIKHILEIADGSRILGDPEAYRLSRPRLHETIARLYLYKGVNDSVSKLEATAYVVQQLELILPTDAPAGCLHYSRAEVNQFIMHSMSYSDSDDADASLLHLLRKLDYFYLSQTASDPYSEFLAMHWAKGVTWEAYVLSIIHFAQKH